MFEAARIAIVLVLIALAGCTFLDHGGRGVTDRPSHWSVPDIGGVDLAKAVKRLRDAGLRIDMSSLTRIERSYGRQLVAGYYQSHPRVVVVSYAVDRNTVFVTDVDCRRRPAC